MKNKKALAGVLLSLSLAGGIVAPASVAFATDETPAVAPVAEAPATEASTSEARSFHVEIYQNGELLYQGLKPIQVKPGEDPIAVARGPISIEEELGVFLRGEIENVFVRLYYTTEAPTTEAPTTEVPTTEVPTTEVPTTEAPTTEVPTTEAPTTEAPTTEVPTTEAPTTEVPTTEVPTTEAPTTEVPTTEAPTTEAPTTEVPTTEAPVTESQKATISFDLAGGSLNGQTGTVTLEARVGDVITLPEAPTREGYRFLYWKGSVYQPGANYTVTGPKTFVAVWEPVAVPTTTTTTASEGPKKILPVTGDAGSILSLVGLGVAGFAGLLGLKHRRKN